MIQWRKSALSLFFVCASGLFFLSFSKRLSLEVHVERARFLALDGPEAVRALGAVADAEEVPEGQPYQRAEAVRAGQGVLRQHGAARVVGRQLRGKSVGVRAAELHVQLGLTAALRLSGRVPCNCRVELPRAGQAQPDGAVSLGRREGHEDRGAVADAVGVRLVPHDLPDLVGARDVSAARFGFVQDLPRCSVCVWLR